MGRNSFVGRSGTMPQPKTRTTQNSITRSRPKGNTSILNFFSKTDGPRSRQSRITEFGVKTPRSTSNIGNGQPKTNNRSTKNDEGLFFGGGKSRTGSVGTREQSPDVLALPDDNITADPAEGLGENWGSPTKEVYIDRFNELGGSNKRRKIENPDSTSSATARQYRGPFIEESDCESDSQDEIVGHGDTLSRQSEEPSPVVPDDGDGTGQPSLLRTATSKDGEEFEDDSMVKNFENVDGACDSNDFDDLFDEADVEALEDSALGDTSADLSEDAVSKCPICQSSLSGLSISEVSVHVNACLDGNSASVSDRKEQQAPPNHQAKQDKTEIAQPGQKDSLGDTAKGIPSAFTKLMAGEAESSAWAAAAAREVASKGRQAHERKCPFYKILPGFSICVDAFRYGAVEGCRAYFLSHFHSDHYVGLTASWQHGPIYCSRVTGNLVRQQLKVDPKWVVDLEFDKTTEVPDTDGVRVTMIPANHCPGSSVFIFEKVMSGGRLHRILHCGDFRASLAHVQHPLLRPEVVDEHTGKPRQQRIDVCYLDTTYLNPKYAFPPQEDVISACADLCVRLSKDNGSANETLGFLKRNSETGSMNKFLSGGSGQPKASKKEQQTPNGRLLVVVGTYSIGKERICLGIARALKCKIYASPAKQRVCACLEDPELSSRLTDNPLDAQVHMQSMFDLNPETLKEYLDSLKPHFSRVVGFRPTGWNYRPPGGRLLDNPPVSTVLQSRNWKTPFSVDDLVPQRGSNNESMCFGVPYSEHSSFRELTMFCCALHIGRIIPTVNVGSQTSREKMKAWIDRWEAEKRKSGLFPVKGETW